MKKTIVMLCAGGALAAVVGGVLQPAAPAVATEADDLKIEAARAAQKDQMDLATKLADLSNELAKEEPDAETVAALRKEVETLRQQNAAQPADAAEEAAPAETVAAAEEAAEEDNAPDPEAWKAEIEDVKIQAARAAQKDQMDLAAALADLANELTKDPNSEATAEARRVVEKLRAELEAPEADTTVLEPTANPAAEPAKAEEKKADKKQGKALPKTSDPISAAAILGLAGMGLAGAGLSRKFNR